MRWLPFVLAVTLAACGSESNPVGPSTHTPPPPAPLDLSGTWTGRLDVSIDDQPYARLVTATVTQTNTAVVMTFETDADVRGSIDGTLNSTTPPATAIAMLSIDAPSDQPPARCRGSAPMSGTATATEITLTAAVVTTPTCDGELTNLRFSIHR